ncbi:MAG: zinc ribbon domain-containing protein [Clostridia bacterium]|nr:zinc ribbon domain-containing protein [Clostridia bacterium]
MKCSYCGFESNRDYQYCPQCGAVMEKKDAGFTPPPQTDFVYETPTPQPEHKIVTALKDKLFLVVCILISACCGLSFLGGGLPIIRIFLTVYMWVAYSQTKNNTLNPNHIRNISGTVYASYVVNNVLGVFFIVFGLLFSVLITFITSNAELLTKFYEELEATVGSEIVDLFSQYFVTFAGLIGVVISVMGIILIVINIVGRKTIHKFIKSTYMNMGMPTEQIQKASKAYVWLLVFGIFNAVSALSSSGDGALMIFLSEAAYSAALIITAILVKKIFLREK